MSPVPCPSCRGAGREIADDEVCSVCNGVGVVTEDEENSLLDPAETEEEFESSYHENNWEHDH